VELARQIFISFGGPAVFNVGESGKILQGVLDWRLPKNTTQLQAVFRNVQAAFSRLMRGNGIRPVPEHRSNLTFPRN